MMKIDARVENEGVTKSQTLKIGGEILHLRHRRIIYQHRNNRDSALQRDRNFQPDKIRRIIDPTIAFTATAEPSRPDDSDDNSGAFQRLLDLFSKVDAVRNGIKVHKDIPFPKVGL